MNTQKRHYLPYLIIFVSLFVALVPVILANNYLRQDDLMWELWPGMHMSDFGDLYYNTVFQLVRPLCMLSFYITDLISIHIHHSAYVRFLSILTIGTCATLLYHWQLLFNNNRLLAIVFAICAFTLPGMQVFAATANYFLVLTSLLLTFGAVFCWYYAYNIELHRKKYFYLGCALFFAGLFGYPLSPMYAWTLLVICYLNMLTATPVDRMRIKKFFYSAAKTTIAMMVSYYIFCRLFHVIFHVHLNDRSTVVHMTHLGSRLLQIFDILSWHSSFWLWDKLYSWKQSPLILLIALFIAAIIRVNVCNHVKNTGKIILNVLTVLSMCFLLFFLAYSPVFASPEYMITFRYTIATMPILLYVFFWSIEILFLSFSKTLRILGGAFLIALTSFGVVYANLMLADGIVGPHQHDFAYVQQQLAEKVIPLIKENKKVIIHAIDCDGGKNYQYGAHVPTGLEYGMRTCQYQQQVIGITLHSLMSMGYLSNYHKHNDVLVTDDNEIYLKNTPWGDMVVNNGKDIDWKKLGHTKENYTVVTIDTRENPTYQRFDFYKSLFMAVNQ